MQSTRFTFILPALLIALLSNRARADHFTVALELSDGTNSQTAHTETEPPKTREIIARPMMESKLGTRCTAKFKLSCAGKEPLKEVLVHFFVVKIEKKGQTPPPLEPKDVLIETAQTMDFSEGVSTSAELQFTPDQAGIYLVRVETQGAAEEKDHEDYAAIDLVVR